MRSLLFFFSAIVVFLATTASRACINEYDAEPTKTNFTKARNTGYLEALKGKQRPTPSDLADKLAKFQISGKYQDESDYATALLMTGQTVQALEIFERLVEEHPDEYILAANLGTAYELNGQDELALKWIKRGIELNPQAHEGSEWLHVKILEAKIKLKENPDWIMNLSVLGLRFESKYERVIAPKITLLDNNGKLLTLSQVLTAVEYQLYERLFFVKTPDLIVSDLLFTLGELLTVEEAEHAAYDVYRESFHYFAYPDRIDLKRSPLIHPYKRMRYGIVFQKFSRPDKGETSSLRPLVSYQITENVTELCLNPFLCIPAVVIIGFGFLYSRDYWRKKHGTAIAAETTSSQESTESLAISTNLKE